MAAKQEGKSAEEKKEIAEMDEQVGEDDDVKTGRKLTEDSDEPWDDVLELTTGARRLLG